MTLNEIYTKADLDTDEIRRMPYYIKGTIEDDFFYSTEYNKLKSTIPLFIKNEPSLSSKIKNIKTASNDKGGEGALIIKLKKSTK